MGHVDDVRINECLLLIFKLDFDNEYKIQVKASNVIYTSY